MAWMCIIRRFFCFDLQMGTYFVAVFSMVLVAVNILTFAQAIKVVQHELETAHAEDVSLVRSNLTEETIQVSYAGIGFFAADIVMTMILVCGACQLKPCILWSWIVWRLLMFAHLVAVTVFFFIVWEKVPPVGIILLVDLVLTIACFIVAFSLIQQIKENEELKNELSMDSPVILLSNHKRLSSREQYL